MSNLVTSCEFKLTVPIWDLSDDDDRNSLSIVSLFTLLSITPHETPLAELYDSFYDCSTARYSGDPSARTGRGDIFIFLSDSDDESLIAIDMFNEATDQMNTVEIGVSSSSKHGASIEAILNEIRSSAEVASALVKGNLGLRENIAIHCFPRKVTNHNSEFLQHAQFFKNGQLIHSSH